MHKVCWKLKVSLHITKSVRSSGKEDCWVCYCWILKIIFWNNDYIVIAQVHLYNKSFLLCLERNITWSKMMCKIMTKVNSR